MRLRSLIPLVFLTLVTACGASGPRLAHIVPGNMPAGGNFTGVWFSPQYGEMNIVQTGTTVLGEYAKDERHGRIEGTVRGDVMHFQWTEFRELIRGRPITTRGRGYFHYVIDGDDHQIQGEWGQDQNEVGGGPWTGVKAKRRHPHLSTDTGRSHDASDGDETYVVPGAQQNAPAQQEPDDGL